MIPREGTQGARPRRRDGGNEPGCGLRRSEKHVHATHGRDRSYRARVLSFLPAGPGRGGIGPRTQEVSARAECTRPARVPGVRGTMAPTRQAGLLAYGYERHSSGLPAGFPAVAHQLEPLAEYSSGPAPDSHRLPFSSPRASGRNPSISRIITHFRRGSQRAGRNRATRPCEHEKERGGRAATCPSISSTRILPRPGGRQESAPRPTASRRGPAGHRPRSNDPVRMYG